MQRFLLKRFIETPAASYRDRTFSFLVFERFKESITSLLQMFYFRFILYNQPEIIVCSDCGKQYKTRGGLQRHRKPKHINIATP